MNERNRIILSYLGTIGLLACIVMLVFSVITMVIMAWVTHPFVGAAFTTLLCASVLGVMESAEHE